MFKLTDALTDAMTVTEKMTRELGLGLHKSYLRDIKDGTDKMGKFFSPVLEQVDTGVLTETYSTEPVRYKDVAKIHRGENRIGKNGYAIARGDGWVRFFGDIWEQFPDLKPLGWLGTLNNLENKTIKVWYTRSDGYLRVYFSESRYNYAVKNGEIGGESIDDTRKLNEDCPF